MTMIKDFRATPRSRAEWALLGTILIVFVLGVAKLLGQPGLVASWAVLMTYLADSAGTYRQRLGGMGTFAAIALVQLVLVGLLGDELAPILVLLFGASFAGSWLMGYGGRAALVGFVSIIWITLMPGLGVAGDFLPSLAGFLVGSGLVLVAGVVVAQLRESGDWLADRSPVFESRQHDVATLASWSLVRAIAITIGGLIGSQYLELNQLWIALTVNLILPPVLATTWQRGALRAVGTVLGAIVGVAIVVLTADLDPSLLVFELLAAFLVLYTAKGFSYGVFVFFLSVFIVTQLGLSDVEKANFGATERVIATLVGVGIAFITALILRFLVDRSASRREAALT